MEDGSFYNIAYEQKYHDGAFILEEGKSDDRICVILSGSVEVSKTIEDMKFILGILQPGEIFGEFALMGAVKRRATVRAIGETTIGLMDRGFLDYEFNKMSSSFRSILIATVQKYIKMMDRSKSFSFRKHERIPEGLPVKYKSRQALVTAFASNLSEDGLFIRTENPLDVGRCFALELQMEEVAEALEILCQVAWSREETSDPEGKPLGMGVRFYDISEKDAEILKKYLIRARKGNL